MRPLPRQRLLPVVVISVLVTFAVAAALVVPVVVRGLTPTVSTEERVVRLTDGASQVTFVLPGGWSWRTHFGDESRGVAGSPDRRMTVELSLRAGDDAAEALDAFTPGPHGPLSEESLAPGIETVLHARVIANDTLVGALPLDGGAVAFRSSPSPAYDAELAAFLATIEVTR
jgi:hypothetical protein